MDTGETPPMVAITKADLVSAKRAVLVLAEAVKEIKDAEAKRTVEADMRSLMRTIRFAEGKMPLDIAGSSIP